MAMVKIDWEGQREIASGVSFKLPAKEALRLQNVKTAAAFLYVWLGATGTATLVIESAPDPSYPDAMWNALATYTSGDIAGSSTVKIKNLNGVSTAFDISEYLRWRVTSGLTSALQFSLVIEAYDA